MSRYNYGTITSLKEVIDMPQIIPIRDLKNTSDISRKCHQSNEPIFVTKNGYGDMVIMSMNFYEERMFINDVRDKLSDAEDQLKAGKTMDADASLKLFREKYHV